MSLRSDCRQQRSFYGQIIVGWRCAYPTYKGLSAAYACRVTLRLPDLQRAIRGVCFSGGATLTRPTKGYPRRMLVGWRYAYPTYKGLSAAYAFRVTLRLPDLQRAIRGVCLSGDATLTRPTKGYPPRMLVGWRCAYPTYKAPFSGWKRPL